MVKLVAVDVAQLDAVVDFLATFPEEQRDRAYWRSRLRHWWDLNPSFPEKPVRGWALAAGEKIYGFWGAVPQKYQVGGGERMAAYGAHGAPAGNGLSCRYTVYAYV